MGSLKEGNPAELLNLAEEVQRGFDESGKLPDRLVRYAFARDRALANLSQIRVHATENPVFSAHLQQVAPKIAVCGDYLAFRHYYTVGKVRLTAANFCKVHLLCPLCAIRRGSKALEAYLTRFDIIKAENPGLRASMLTLTVKNGQDLAERFQHLKKSLKTMLERRRKTLARARGWHSEFAKIAGLVGSIELTKDGALDGSESGWHPHAHMIVLHADNFDYARLQAEWLKITGDSHVLRVDALHHPDEPAQDFLEVFKYALKFADLTPEQNIDAYEVMRGKRLLFSAGLFWGVDVPEELTDTPLDDLPYIELFYAYLHSSVYSLVKTRRSDDIQLPDLPPVDPRCEFFRKDMERHMRGRKKDPSLSFEPLAGFAYQDLLSADSAA